MAVNKMEMSKMAAEALRLVPGLIEENKNLRDKVAEYRRKERIAKIASLFVEKRQIGEHELPMKVADLTSRTEIELDRIESALGLISPSGGIKLGTVAGDVHDTGGQASQGAEERFSRFLLSGGEESGE